MLIAGLLQVVYRSEAGLPALVRVSNTISRVTGLVVNRKKFDSENYQIMNYGLGGAILVHQDVDDASSIDETYSDHVSHGGPRLLTYMVYLTEVEEGGNTVFTSAGVASQPNAGDALFW